MPWLALLSYFIGGAVLANAVPHLVCGMTGRPFQTPFAKPPGKAFRDHPRSDLLLVGTAAFGSSCMLAAIASSYWFFAAAPMIIGGAALTFINATNSLMQLSVEPAMRGRVIALRVAVAVGGTPIGCADRRLGGQQLRPTLGVGCRRDLRLRRGHRRLLRFGSPKTAIIMTGLYQAQ